MTSTYHVARFDKGAFNAQPATTRETISCGCCRGPENDRCACWHHRATTPANLTRTIDGRYVAHACSDCAPVSVEGGR